jgi:transcriptional regulator with XRE-family HTH domain
MGRKPTARRDGYGAWLHHLRTERHLTQEQLAKLLGVPRTTLAYWERSGNLAGRMVILKMAAAFKIPLVKLLRPDKGRDKGL